MEIIDNSWSSAGVHSINGFGLFVPDIDEAQRFTEAFGLDVTRSGDELQLRTFGASHVWATVLPASRKALETINERYYAPELKMTVYHRRSDPRNGESLYRMTDIKRSEPDATLFRIPPGYATSEGKR